MQGFQKSFQQKLFNYWQAMDSVFLRGMEVYRTQSQQWLRQNNSQIFCIKMLCQKPINQGLDILNFSFNL
jgi:hypothetical protein